MTRETGPLEPTPLVKSLIDGVKDIVVVIGLDYRVMFMNRAASELYLDAPDSPEPLHCYNLFHRNTRECPVKKEHCPVAMVRKTGRTVESVHRHYGKDGQKVVEVIASPLWDTEGGVYGVVKYCRDVTRRADLFAMILHDIKSPLSVILGYSQLLITDQISEMSNDMAGMVKAIHSNGLRLQGIVEDLLTVSSLESRQPVADTKPASLETLLDEVHQMFWGAAMSKGLELTVERCIGMPDVELDRDLVLRALSNLVQNAISYTPRGGKVTVRSGISYVQSGIEVDFSVSDTGPGIAAEEHERVFEKYYRSPMITETSGTGLGLAIVKGIAELYGGHVELRSESGKGSTFRLVLPVMMKAA